MNQYVLAILFFASLAAEVAKSAPRNADVVPVFHCAFGKDWDENYDLWPDRWVRKTGSAYPHYVDMKLAGDADAERWLQIDLDGAGAAITSPPIRVMSRFSYKLEVKLKNEQLDYSRVVVTLDFYDSAGRLLPNETKKSSPVGTTEGWQSVTLDEIEPKNPAIDRAVVGLEVVRGDKGDLEGRVSMGDVWLERRPRILVTTNNPYNVYTGLGDVAVKCELSGIPERNPKIQFELLDAANKPVDGGSFPLDGRLINENNTADGSVVAGVGSAPAGYEGSREWKPKITQYGYYHVVVRMLSSEGSADENDRDRELDKSRTIWLAVVPPLDVEMPKRGEFGWTLPNGDAPLSLDNLCRLLPQVGINWVKFPAWYDANNARRGDELIRFVELLGASNIEVVGIIDRPPVGTELAAHVSADTPVSALLSPEAAASWSAALEPVMTRLSLRVRWWQLGRDFDTSFVGDADVSKRIGDIRTKLFRFGQDVRLGMCWDWDTEKQTKGNVPWDFQQLCMVAAPSAEKFDALLAKRAENSALHWVIIEPPAHVEATGEERQQAEDEQFRRFVMQLVTAKERGAEAIFIANPFNDQNGLMRSNGMPAQTLLPWRTTAAMLGGAKFIGSIQLPNGSENRIFLRPDDKLVMVVWNNKPTREVLYLGKKIRQFDIFGFSSTPEMENNEHVIEVGPRPKFVLGLHDAITRTRMSLAFEHAQVPSIYSRPHANGLRFHNYFSQGIGGTLSIVVPKDERDRRVEGERKTGDAPRAVADRMTIDPPQGVIKLAKGADTQIPFEIRLGTDAAFGKQPVRVEFNVDADEHYQFSVYRTLEVGTADLTLEVYTFLDEDGALIVEQRMTNLSKDLADFKCELRGAPRRQRTQVYRLGKEVDKHIYRFPNGKELLNQELSLEIEELNGERMIRYSFIVTDSPPPEENEAATAAGTGSEPAKRASARNDGA